MDGTFERDTSTGGCWIAYSHDNGPYLISAHASEVEALRSAVDNYGKACWLPWGMRLEDAVRQAEGQ